MSDADICRQNNWTKGVIIQSGEHPKTVRVAIVDVGQTVVFGRRIDGDGMIQPVDMSLNWSAIGRQIDGTVPSVARN